MNLARIAVLLQQTPEEAVEKEEYVGPFAKVLSAIDDMLNVIQVEGEEDEKKHSWCETTRSEKRDERDAAKVNMDELTDTLIPGVEGEIEQLKKDIQDAQNKLAENQKEQAVATADRKDANVVYHQTITDATQAQRILGKAINILTAYYAKIAPKPTRESFAQQPVDTMSEAPDTFEGAYTGRSEGGNTVIGLLDSLLQDVREEEGRDHEAEIESQHAYEDNMSELTNIQETLENTLIQKNENLADKNSELTRKKERLTKETETWETTKAYLASIKEGCDFMKDNIDFRRKNREGEKEALNFAKTELKGTPAHKDAVTEHEQLLLGECKDTCNKDGRDYATCKACLAKVTVPAYCAGHPEVMGC
jgi:chromosome segregation ATPase